MGEDSKDTRALASDSSGRDQSDEENRSEHHSESLDPTRPAVVRDRRPCEHGEDATGDRPDGMYRARADL